MKLKLEVEVNGYVAGELDEIIRERIEAEVLSQVREHVADKIIKDMSVKISDNMDEWIMKAIHSFTDRPIRLTDNYGTVKETYANIEDMLKEKLDAFLSENVDQNGRKVDACGYGKKATRLDWVLDNRIAAQTDAWTKDVVGKVDAKIKGVLNDTMKAQISAKILNKIDMADILK